MSRMATGADTIRVAPHRREWGGGGMGFVEAIQAGFNNYTNFSGRATRPEYWWWFLFSWIVSIVAQILDGATRVGPVGTQTAAGTFVGIITIIVGLALIIPSWAVLVRRLHD